MDKDCKTSPIYCHISSVPVKTEIGICGRKWKLYSPHDLIRTASYGIAQFTIVTAGYIFS